MLVNQRRKATTESITMGLRLLRFLTFRNGVTKKGCPWNRTTCTSAALNGHFELELLI
jgi:hypothetical protein